MRSNLIPAVMVVFASSVVRGGIDLNHTVERMGDRAVVNVFVHNRDAGGRYPGFIGGLPTGTRLFGANIDFRLSAEKRAYFRTYSDRPLLSKLDGQNFVDDPNFGWARVGVIGESRVFGATPSPNYFSINSNPWDAGVNDFGLLWGRLLFDGGVDASMFPGAHAVRLVVDFGASIELTGSVTTVANENGSDIPSTDPYVIHTIPEPGWVGSILVGSLFLVRRPLRADILKDTAYA